MLWSRNAQLVTDDTCQCVLDFAMTRDRRAATIRRITKDRMFAAFSIQDAPVAGKMPNQFAAFHARGTSTVKFSQKAFPATSFVALPR